MARKRDEAIKANLAGWLDDAAAAEAADDASTAEHGAQASPAALSLHRRAGTPDVLVAMAQDGRAWEVPDRAGGWTARRELRSVAARALTRLSDADERRAVARLEVQASDLAPAAERVADVGRPAENASIDAFTQPGAAGPTSAPATPAPARGRPDKRRMVGAYLDAAEVEALEARAAAEDRSVSYIVRAAVRAYLDLG